VSEICHEIRAGYSPMLFVGGQLLLGVLTSVGLWTPLGATAGAVRMGESRPQEGRCFPLGPPRWCSSATPPRSPPSALGAARADIGEAR
jgi:hypothetical protein